MLHDKYRIGGCFSSFGIAGRVPVFVEAWPLPWCGLETPLTCCRALLCWPLPLPLPWTGPSLLGGVFPGVCFRARIFWKIEAVMSSMVPCAAGGGAACRAGGPVATGGGAPGECDLVRQEALQPSGVAASKAGAPPTTTVGVAGECDLVREEALEPRRGVA